MVFLWHKYRKQITLFSIGEVAVGIGVNIFLAFSPNIVPPLSATILVIFSIILITIGVIFILVAIFTKQDKHIPTDIKSKNDELKRAIAKAKIASDELVKYIHHIKKLDEKQINQNVINTYNQKVSAYQDSINCMEVERLAAGSEISEIVKPLLIFFPLSIA